MKSTMRELLYKDGTGPLLEPQGADEGANPAGAVFKNTASHGGGECNGKVNKKTKPKPKCLRVIGFLLYELSLGLVSFFLGGLLVALVKHFLM